MNSSAHSPSLAHVTAQILWHELCASLLLLPAGERQIRRAMDESDGELPDVFVAPASN